MYKQLKHGRVCMLATLGWVVADLGIHLPGDIHQVSSLAAHDVFVKSGAMVQILGWCGVLEIITIPALIKMDISDRPPGGVLYLCNSRDTFINIFDMTSRCFLFEHCSFLIISGLIIHNF